MMDDLISRQAAIDAMESYSKFVWNRYREPFNLGAVASILTDLPSAQPEITVEQVKEFCEERGFVVLTKEEYRWLKSLKSKAEEFRWNGGGNY